MFYLILFGLFLKEAENELVKILVGLSFNTAKANETQQILFISAVTSLFSLFLCLLTF